MGPYRVMGANHAHLVVRSSSLARLARNRPGKDESEPNFQRGQLKFGGVTLAQGPDENLYESLKVGGQVEGGLMLASPKGYP